MDHKNRTGDNNAESLSLGGEEFIETTKPILSLISSPSDISSTKAPLHFPQPEKNFLQGSQPVTPKTGQQIRLRGGKSPWEGYVELYVLHKNGEGSWSLICDEEGKWNLKEANVVCRQLGYHRSAQSRLYINMSDIFFMLAVIYCLVSMGNSVLDTPLLPIATCIDSSYVQSISLLTNHPQGASIAWQGIQMEKDVLQDVHVGSVQCMGSEDSMLHCIKEHNFTTQCNLKKRAVGVRCQTEYRSLCGISEVPFAGQCYFLVKGDESKPFLSRDFAAEECRKRGAVLLSINSQVSQSSGFFLSLSSGKQF
ncbi:hypothetical protein J437_LFUL016568 [Ladona fulva]|uniref:SRCR domain-containing protein n=1 Tax=Ladona fulva TaxID=123851 RepID=A0A8K0KNS0_LADFU|nr:hypothetical protein J437_LFUL016568 [Ladona fulva]